MSHTDAQADATPVTRATARFPTRGPHPEQTRTAPRCLNLSPFLTSPVRRRWPFVVVAALLAHVGCLWSVFYLDDWSQIVECDWVDQGTWYAIHQRALTYLTYFLTYRVFGMSPVAFHAGNLLLHVGTALALLGFAKDYLSDAARLPPERAERIAGWGALLFAVHPLCSEMTNYVRARDIGLVSFFALLAAWATLRWRRDGAGRWLGAAVAAILAAAFCKEVGLPVAVGTALLTALGTRRRSRGQDPASSNSLPDERWLRTVLFLGLALTVVLLVGCIGGLVPMLWRVAGHSLSNARMGWHILTEARVFWMYLARVAWPARLCSDHLIAWTISNGDTTAWVSAVGEGGLALASVLALCQRRRPSVRAAGALGAVALLDIAHRLANVSAELMVEYRMYPAMLPICLLLAWGLDGLRGFASARRNLPPATGRIVLGGIVAACLLTSARRAFDWHSLDALVANVVAQYPANARARQELQEADIRAKRWESVVSRQAGIRQAADDANAYNAAHAERKYDPEHVTMTRIISEGNAALGLARQGKRSEAFRTLTWIHSVMDRNGLTDPLFWGAYYYSSALVHDAIGERQDALDDLKLSVECSGDLIYPTRQLRRYRRGEPLP